MNYKTTVVRLFNVIKIFFGIYVAFGLIKGPKSECPGDAWTIDASGRNATNDSCCSSCHGGAEHCYSDCGWY